jgi:hypothetical protein
MTKTFVVGGAAAVVLMLAMGSSVSANETGLAQALHDMRRVGGRTCLVDHYHDGSGSGATRTQAQASAISAWSGFTAWEYGSSWGRYGLAISRSMNCSKDMSGGWSCQTSAIACRPW